MTTNPKKNNNQAAWSGLVLVVVTFMLIAVYFLRLDSLELVSYDIDPNLVVYKTKVANAAGSDLYLEYINEQYGFKIKYSDSSTIITKSNEEGDLVIFTIDISNNNETVTINVMPVELGGIVRSSINIDYEDNILIDEVNATRIDGTSVKDGSDMSMIIIETNDNLITIEGAGQNFEDIVSYFEII